MILAFDTYYFDNKAKTVCVTFNNWTDSEPRESFEEIIYGVKDYEPGAFYKRELPCILSLLNNIPKKEIKAIIVDGYVILNDQNKLGLGGYLFKSLEAQIPIVGVAKSSFRANRKNVKELYRGQSKKPLYITALGMDLGVAYEYIKSMHGSYRMPTLLQVLDTKTKEI